MTTILAKLTVSNLFSNYGLILVFYLILTFSLVVRIVNLNFNSLFNDEAIYIVLGKLGLFQGDWHTYGSANWVAGVPFIYPSLSALAYSAGGLIGTRLLSVIFGLLMIEAIFTLTTQLTKAPRLYQYLSGIIAASIVGASGVAIYVSRLATYDAPSFYLLVISLVFLHQALTSANPGKWFFLSSLCLLSSFMTKIITGIYLPLIFIYSFWAARDYGLNQLYYWKRYFVLPVIVGLSIYGVFYLPNLITYQQSQSGLEWYDWQTVFNTYWENSNLVWFFFLYGAYGLYLKRSYRLLFTLTIAAVWILLLHLYTHRFSTLDKHTTLSIIFLAPAIGIGVSYLIELARNKILKSLIILLVVLMLGYHWQQTIPSLNKFNNQWVNTTTINQYLGKIAKPGDKILVESGASSILAVYHRNYPINVTTFDWLEYQNITGDQAYISALTDGYFDLIQLESNHFLKDGNTAHRHQLVSNRLQNYRLIYNREGYEIYRRDDE